MRSAHGEVAWAQTTPDGICDRTPQVQTAILERIDGVSDCAAVTEEQLAAITGGLGFWDTGISNLQEDDFAGLSSVQQLDLRHNALESLPAGVFSGLSSLEFLWLADNALSSLPADLFSDATSLIRLRLQNNDLASLPAGVFSDLSSLEILTLGNNAIASLPEDVFHDLSSFAATAKSPWQRSLAIEC